MGLAERVENTLFRIVPHTAGTDFVNQAARHGHARSRIYDFSAGGMENVLRMFEKILLDRFVVVAMRVVNA